MTDRGFRRLAESTALLCARRVLRLSGKGSLEIVVSVSTNEFDRVVEVLMHARLPYSVQPYSGKAGERGDVIVRIWLRGDLEDHLLKPLTAIRTGLGLE